MGGREVWEKREESNNQKVNKPALRYLVAIHEPNADMSSNLHVLGLDTTSNLFSPASVYFIWY